MKIVPLQNRISNLLQNPKGFETANNLLPILRENIKENQNRLQQLRLIILTIFATFLLMYSGIVSEFEISGVKLTNNDIILIMSSVPLVASYFYYELITFFISRRILIEAHEQMLKAKESQVFENHLTEFYLPTSTFIINNILSVNFSKNRVWNIFMKDFGGVIGSMTIILPLLFCIFSHFVSSKKIFFSEIQSNELAKWILILSSPLILTFLSNSILILYQSILLMKKNEKQV